MPSNQNTASFTVETVDDSSPGLGGTITVQRTAASDDNDCQGSAGTLHTVTVTDSDPNNAPAFPPGTVTSFSMDENTTGVVAVGTPVVAQDADGHGLSYSLAGTDAGSFEIDASTAQISTKAGTVYDQETNPSYSLTVRATDDWTPPATGEISVTVTLNDLVELPAAPSRPTLVAGGTRLQATWSAPVAGSPPPPPVDDYDVRYCEGAGCAAAASPSFSDAGHSGTATSAVISGLTLETVYEVQVRAHNDDGYGPWSAAAQGRTLDNNAPTFPPGTVTAFGMDENTTGVVPVGTPVVAQDADGHGLSYSLAGTDAGSFEIDAATAQISTKAGTVYDQETNPTYSLTVRATDDFVRPLTGEVSVTVTLNDLVELPAAPSQPTLVEGGGWLQATWSAPVAGSPPPPPPDRYEVRYCEGAGCAAAVSPSFSDAGHSGTATTAVISGLTLETVYEVQVRARNDDGYGPWSAAAQASTLVDQSEPPRPDIPTPTVFWWPVVDPPDLDSPPPDRFTDDDGHTHEDAINHAASLGIVTACSADGALFCPEQPVTRAEMALMLARARDLPDAGPETPSFDDVPSNHFAYAAVEALRSAGVVVGCSADGALFCPEQPVTRAEMALMLVRAFDLPDASLEMRSFDDVLPDHFAFVAVEALRFVGITVGCSADGALFCPEQPVTRAEAAGFLSRILEYLDSSR